ncbi:MAG: hypothetical protein K940chlam3_01204 [Chlamydiae bacterium]|nr:hypothetical protein [Chlamydiota bacterium]
MKRILLLFTLFFTILSANSYSADDVNIVFVHIGPVIPPYAHDAIQQAHLFNPEGDIYMLGNQTALDQFNDPYAIQIALESLSPTHDHQRFIKIYCVPDGLFRFSMERFFYLDEFINLFDLHDVFHLEYDNMLYVDLKSLLLLFRKYTPTLGGTFDNDGRCVPGFVYVSGSEAIRDLASFIGKNSQRSYNDMEMLAYYKNCTRKKGIDHLPIIHISYASENKLLSPMGHVAKNPHDYSRHVDEFDSIFDAAAIGQYLGGTDPNHTVSKPGFINESCVFNPEKLTYIWEADDCGRLIPYAIYKEEKRRINNLHVHCKNLKQFAS